MEKEQQPFLHSMEEIRYQFMATPLNFSSKSGHFLDILQTVFEDDSIDESYFLLENKLKNTISKALMAT